MQATIEINQAEVVKFLDKFPSSVNEPTMHSAQQLCAYAGLKGYSFSWLKENLLHCFNVQFPKHIEYDIGCVFASIITMHPTYKSKFDELMAQMPETDPDGRKVQKVIGLD